MSRHWRRAILAGACIAVASPVAAEHNQPSPVQLRRPVLVPTQTDAKIHQNPFVHGVASGLSAPVELASGDHQTTLRLKPIGTAVGLHTIENGPPVAVRPPVMTITTPKSGIRVNPLIVSEHHENADLIEAAVEPADERLQLDWDQRNRINLLPAAPPIPPVHIETSGAAPAVMVPVPKQTIVPSPTVRTFAPQAATVAAPIAEPASVNSIPPAAAKPTGLESAQSPVSPAGVAQPAPLHDTAISIPAATPETIAHEQPLAPIAQPANEQPANAQPANEQPANAQPGNQQPANTEQQTAAADQPVLFSLSDGSVDVSISDLLESPSSSSPSDSTSEGKLPKPVVLSDPIEDLLKPMMVEAPEAADQEDFQPVELDSEDGLPAAVQVAPPSIVDRRVDLGTAEEAEPESIPQPVVIAEVTPIQMESTAANDPDSSQLVQPAEPLQAIDELPPSLIYRAETGLGPTTPDAEALSSTQRHRPPVAVDAPPLVIERLETETRPTLPSVAAAAEIDPTMATGAESTPTAHPAGDRSNLTSLHMTRAQVRSLMIGGQVRRISVADKNVCQAFTNGPNELKLIGVNNGVTRLVVWADTSDDSPTQVRTFEIHVADVIEASDSSIVDRIALLNRSIADAFPRSNIEVRQYRNRLVVLGDCEHDEIAKKIIRMVRKTCLIPVQDEITIR